jgi:acyl-CoA thioester hydrolase
VPPFAHQLRVRYHECDVQGVVFNAHHFTYFDIAVTELLRATFGSYKALVESGGDLMLAAAEASFRSPAHFDDELTIELGLARIGNSSITLECRERRGDELLVDGSLVQVYVSPGTLVKQPVPDEIREALGQWTLNGPGQASGRRSPS